MWSPWLRHAALRIYEYSGWSLNCPACGRVLDDCACVCPFCGERDGCRCCIGLGVATGGD